MPIDEPTTRLMEKLNRQLPIPALPTQAFINSMREENILFTQTDELLIDSVLYLGEEGGIGCALLTPKSRETVLITSITHLKIKKEHPLSQEIEAYQQKRIGGNLSNKN